MQKEKGQLWAPQPSIPWRRLLCLEDNPPTPEGAPACGIVGKGFPLGLQAVEALITHMSRPRSSSPYTEFKVM
jgi:hypothetical protein